MTNMVQVSKHGFLREDVFMSFLMAREYDKSERVNLRLGWNDTKDLLKVKSVSTPVDPKKWRAQDWFGEF